MPETDLLTSRAAARAKELEFFARTRVEGFLKSFNRSKLKGHSTDFMQHRQYMPGDSLRSIDWRVFARSDRLVTREYEEYTNLGVVIGVDFSGSMGYKGRGPTKIDFCRHCAAMLCYLLLSQRDSFGLAVMTDTVMRYLRPAGSRRHMAELFNQLVSVQTAGETDFAACVNQLLRRVQRRSVFVFFSDCYQDPAALTKALGTLVIRGHDVALYQVYDQDELDLDFAGFTLFKDLETGMVDAADPLEIRAAYQEVFAEHTQRLRDGANRFRIDFNSIPVTNDWDAALAALLRKRALLT